jgi:hypothetical protein
MNTLETILEEILTHDEDHPDHGVGCSCMDEHARKIRELMNQEGINQQPKSLSNFKCVLQYICRS